MRHPTNFITKKIIYSDYHLWITLHFTMVFFKEMTYNTFRSKFLPKCLSGKKRFQKFLLALASLKKFSSY
ncbi:MAG: hypothetical protein A2261_01945 [Candidatus Magasanikbacteria bacterium RIFOXYA2_FULL_44_8]|uniref:Uncharacterized protein n=1 Tax=Candidatus Magasanikbacteria bacterium RIFOXYA2_FULL_44_8 TaxID=1798696 RepID=A0A1F6NKW2_9BACT|nr:MAG: hypothetical protein A2261_01945 [Candidatus Magasanikbacteria bacterium RIFOXYA2_FULL_44_8]